MSDDDPVQVYEAGNSMEAHFIVQMLTDVGVEARIASSAVENIAGEVPVQRAVCPIWVRQRDLDRASKAISGFLAERKDGSSEEVETIFCYHCGSPLDDLREQCPQCNASLDWSS